VFDANKELFLEDFEPSLVKEKLKKIFTAEEIAEIEKDVSFVLLFFIL
jgi:hypothetical protein